MGFPNFPGIPPLASGFVAAIVDTALLTADGASIYNVAQPAQWGIFLGGAPVIVADTVSSFSYKQEWAISDYPVEGGAFQSYDKVQIPFDVRVRFATGGSAATRAALLASISAIAGDTNLYDVVTPEATYTSVSISHYDYTRTAVNGVGLLQVDVWCFNVVVSASTSFQSTQSPSGADQGNDGTVQALPPSPGGGGAPTPSIIGGGTSSALPASPGGGGAPTPSSIGLT